MQLGPLEDPLPFEVTEAELRAEARRQETELKIQMMIQRHEIDKEYWASWSDTFHKEQKEREKREMIEQLEYEASLSFQLQLLIGNIMHYFWILVDLTVTPFIQLLTRTLYRINDFFMSRDR